MRLNKLVAATAVATLLTVGVASQFLLPVALAQSAQAAGTPTVAVAPQYDTTHVYIAPEDFDRFVASLIATFGGTTSKHGAVTVTPTPTSTTSQFVLSPV